MKNRKRFVSIFTVLLLTSFSGLAAAGRYKVLNSDRAFYYGHISYVEATAEGTDPVVVREGGAAPERAVVNLPVGPGDTVRTSADKRCEIQFDSGTLVRLDYGTEVRVETILARSLSSLRDLSTLMLNKGRIYVMYKEYDRLEMFQILTPNAAVKLKHNAVATVAAAEDGSTDAQVRYGRAWVRFGHSEDRLTDFEVKKDGRLIVQKNNQFQLAPYLEGTAFELWNRDVNRHFDELHKGLSALPKPLQRLPKAVFYFAQNFGSLYGEWLWDDLYGYVWRPFLNNGMYPWGWRPYYYGQWAYAGGQMFWVPQEPWGWIPYHLGIWQWDKKHGWVWLPGSLFAPAWVDWEFFFGYASWRPWSLFDWYGGANVWGFYYFNGGWMYGRLNPHDGAKLPGRTPDSDIRDAVVSRQAVYPVPGELKASLKKVTAAFLRGDERVRASAIDAPRQLLFVAKDDLRAAALRDRILTWDQVQKPEAPAAAGPSVLRRPANPQREAVRVFRGAGAKVPPSLKENEPAPGRDQRDTTAARLAAPAAAAGSEAGRGRAEGPAGRFRDWNPDVRVARLLGVHIEYSSAKNEVRCPELEFSSADRIRYGSLTPRLTRGGISYEPVPSLQPGRPDDGSSSAASGAQGSGEGQAGSSSRGSSSSERGESGKGEGGKVKK